MLKDDFFCNCERYWRSIGVLSSPEQSSLLPLADGGVGFKDMRPLSFLTSCHGSSGCHAYWPCEKDREQKRARASLPVRKSRD